MAHLNITYGGMNGDMPDAVPYDMADVDIKRVATEAVATGHIPGIPAQVAEFADFIVDRFPASGDLPDRLMLRPKTPFGFLAYFRQVPG